MRNTRIVSAIAIAKTSVLTCSQIRGEGLLGAPSSAAVGPSFFGFALALSRDTTSRPPA